MSNCGKYFLIIFIDLKCDAYYYTYIFTSVKCCCNIPLMFFFFLRYLFQHLRYFYFRYPIIFVPLWINQVSRKYPVWNLYCWYHIPLHPICRLLYIGVQVLLMIYLIISYPIFIVFPFAEVPCRTFFGHLSWSVYFCHCLASQPWGSIYSLIYALFWNIFFTIPDPLFKYFLLLLRSYSSIFYCLFPEDFERVLYLHTCHSYLYIYFSPWYNFCKMLSLFFHLISQSKHFIINQWS